MSIDQSKTSILFILKFRHKESPLKGEIEVYESYFGGRRIKGLRDRGAFGKLPVFGLLKKTRKVYTEVTDDWKAFYFHLKRV